MQAVSQYERLTAEWDKQQHKNALLELKAPHAGMVKDIASHTIGTVVNPGTILLTIVPIDEPLIAEVQVKNADSGFIFPTQKVRIKISTFPFQKYGMVDGEVTHVGADSSDTAGGRPEELNPESRLSVTSYYKAHIQLRDQRLKRDELEFKLLPGMQVIAEVRLGERTVLEYLLSPVQKAIKEAGRER
jgi:HlyD family secretion protein